MSSFSPYSTFALMARSISVPEFSVGRHKHCNTSRRLEVGTNDHDDHHQGYSQKHPDNPPDRAPDRKSQQHHDGAEVETFTHEFWLDDASACELKHRQDSCR